jgi:SAM-dependent methyltransferase
MPRETLLQKGKRKLYRGLKIIHERINGIDFTKGMTLEELGLTAEEGNIYAASSPDDLKNIFGHLDIQPTDAILDFGCGKGGAMFEMSKFPFARISGVEINAHVCTIARNNFRQLGIEHLEVFQSEAGAFIDLDGFNYFYLYNPFPEPVVLKVLNNIQASYRRHNRKIALIYYLPAQQELIERHGFLQYSHTISGLKYDTAFFVKL